MLPEHQAGRFFDSEIFEEVIYVQTLVRYQGRYQEIVLGEVSKGGMRG